MLTNSIFRLIGAAAFVAALGGCEGDDNSLPGPVDAGSHSDAAAKHDAGPDANASGAGASADAAPDAEAQADAAGDTSTGTDAGDATIGDVGVTDGAVDALPPVEAGDSE